MPYGVGYCGAMASLTAAVKARALAEGFDLVGVAAAGPTPGAEVLGDWLAEGFHGEMAYMARTAELRADPRRVLPGCRSLVAVAMSYHSALPPSREAVRGGRVWVSRFAWGRDYHKLLKKRLIRLGRTLERLSPGAGWRATVDTAPVAERAWAAAAGLGWLGRNTCLIHPRLGSELFLGILLTDLALEPDPPATSHCGRCTACLDACPTAALVAPSMMDARRCIAYLTVEHRTEIDPALAPSMGAMVAGCDICQEVCPFNRRAAAGLHPELAPVPHRVAPRLGELEQLDEAGWREWRRGSTLNRVSHSMLRRNLAVARANLTRARDR